MISAGYCKDYIGKSYKYAVSILESKGFTNIETIYLDDSSEEKKADTVDSVAIAGRVF